MHERTRQNIKSLMDARGMNPRQLTLRVQTHDGLEKTSPSTITRFLSGFTQDVHYALLKAIAEELDTTVDSLTGDAPMTTVDSRIAAVVRVMEFLPDIEKDIIVNTSKQLAKRYMADA